MKWLKIASSPPKGNPEDGFFGFSRAYDRVCDFLPTLGVKTLFLSPYVSRFAFSNSARPEHQVQVSWAGHGDSDSSIKLVIEETIWDFKGSRKDGLYVIKTDKSHNFMDQGYFGTCVMAVQELRKKANVGLTPEGRWGLPLRMLSS